MTHGPWTSAPHQIDARPVTDHQPFAILILRQIVGAHRALCRAEAAPEGERERVLPAARQRLNQLIQQASVQFPSLSEVAPTPGPEPRVEPPSARH